MKFDPFDYHAKLITYVKYDFPLPYGFVPHFYLSPFAGFF